MQALSPLFLKYSRPFFLIFKLIDSWKMVEMCHNLLCKDKNIWFIIFWTLKPYMHFALDTLYISSLVRIVHRKSIKNLTREDSRRPCSYQLNFVIWRPFCFSKFYQNLFRLSIRTSMQNLDSVAQEMSELCSILRFGGHFVFQNFVSNLFTNTPLPHVNKHKHLAYPPSPYIDYIIYERSLIPYLEFRGCTSRLIVHY